MKAYTVQWKENGILYNTDVGAESLEEAKQAVVKSKGIKYSQIIKEGAWR